MRHLSPESQTRVMVVMSVLFVTVCVIAAVFAADSRNKAEAASKKSDNGQKACNYQKARYPSTRDLARAVKLFMESQSARLEREAELFTKISRTVSGVARSAAEALAEEKHDESTKAGNLAAMVVVFPSPTCTVEGPGEG